MAFALDDVFVVPLQVGGLAEPALEVGGVDVGGLVVEEGGVLEFAAAEGEEGLVEGGAAPEHEADAGFLFAVADDGVAVEKPDGVGVPNFGDGAGEVVGDLLGEEGADGAVVGGEGCGVGGDVHGEWGEGGSVLVCAG